MKDTGQVGFIQGYKAKAAPRFPDPEVSDVRVEGSPDLLLGEYHN